MLLIRVAATLIVIGVVATGVSNSINKASKRPLVIDRSPNVKLTTSRNYTHVDFGVSVVESDIMNNGLPLKFQVVNDSGSPGELRLKGTSCGCLNVQGEAWALEPNQEMFIDVTFQMTGQPTAFRHYLDFEFTEKSGEKRNLLVATDGILLPEVWSESPFSARIGRKRANEYEIGVLLFPIEPGTSNTELELVGTVEDEALKLAFPAPEIVEFSQGCNVLRQPICLEIAEEHYSSFLERETSQSLVEVSTPFSAFSARVSIESRPETAIYPRALSFDRSSGARITEQIRVVSKSDLRIDSIRWEHDEVSIEALIRSETTNTVVIDFAITSLVQNEPDQFDGLPVRALISCRDKDSKEVVAIPIYIW